MPASWPAPFRLVARRRASATSDGRHSHERLRFQRRWFPYILWQNTTSGERYLWFINGTTIVGAASLGTMPVDWSIAAAADFDGDGHPDILWQNTATGQRYLWLMNCVTPIDYADLGTMPVAWSIAN